MDSKRVLRASAIAGVVAAILILVGSILSYTGIPEFDADAAAWAAWAEREELTIELGVYVLLVPGLLLFLCMFAGLAGLLPANAISTRLAGYGAVAFFVFFAAAGVLSSTSASTFGFFGVFDDPTAVTVFTGVSAGYHLQGIAAWSLAMTMLAAAVGLRNAAVISSPLYVGSIVLAVLTVAASQLGIGVMFCLVWMPVVSIWLLRWTPSRSAAIDPIADARPSY